MNDPTSGIIHFGGGNRPPGLLRDLLAQRIEEVPRGGRISWLLYYFRDGALAEALIRAAERGVRVTVTVDGAPRQKEANREVISMLTGAHPNLRVKAFGNLLLPLRLHSKLYCFSHPEPTVLLGSFNPSSRHPETSPAIVEAIGDHDQGFNLLAEWNLPALWRRLSAYAEWLHGRTSVWIPHLSPMQYRSWRHGDLVVHALPRLFPHPVMALLQRLGPGTSLKVASSHVKGLGTLCLRRHAARGMRIELVTGIADRRSPSELEERLAGYGITVHRVGKGWVMPMHDKFLLIRKGDKRYAVLGSFNWNTGSMLRNLELVAISTNPQLCDMLEARWDELLSFAADNRSSDHPDLRTDP